MLRKNRFCHSDPGGILSNMVGRIEEVPRRRVLVACRDHPLPTRGELWLMLPRPPAPTRSRAGRASRDARCGRTRALRPRRAPPSWIERDRVGVDHRALERRHRGRRVRRRPRGDRPAELAPHAASAPRRSRRPAPGCRGPCSGTAGRRAPPPSRTPCAGGASWFTGPPHREGRPVRLTSRSSWGSRSLCESASSSNWSVRRTWPRSISSERALSKASASPGSLGWPARISAFLSLESPTRPQGRARSLRVEVSRQRNCQRDRKVARAR